ncbi:Zn(II)2Cys6 transcription factor [Aspergillus stella-maris]|uniref:Zn(II)2Cys6 transcription factor n=1 Tax=Aspergillus stella-maris TaxID=1810926 RepID=UPI003CCDFD2D
MKTDDGRKRHCWECLRRCLVCDFTEPQCKRCVNSGTLCPGYGEKKPLRLNWMEPGRVKSKTRKKKGKKKGETDSSKVVCTKEKDSYLPSPPKTKTGSKPKQTVFQERIIPRLALKTNEDACCEAIDYFNTAMYPILSRSQFKNHPGVYKIQPGHIKAGLSRPDFLRLDIVCVALNHRMNSSHDFTVQQSLAPTYYHFRGLVLRSLHEAMIVERNATQNVNHLIAGILSLLLADAHHGASPHWRLHLKGIQELITLRGGLRAMSGPGVEPLLLCYAYITVLGDTTTPASELIMSTSLLAELDTILEDHGKEVYSFYPFPTPLFTAVVKINCLRARAAIRLLVTTHVEDLTTEAEELLIQIASFSPEAWARSRCSSPSNTAKHGAESEDQKSDEKHWTLLGTLMQSAITIYCISSLQSLSILPRSPSLTICHTANRQLLHSLLQNVSEGNFLGTFVWPLVVLGVNAGNDAMTMRAFVRNALGPISRDQGSHVPLMARAMLERFWVSGKRNWDECFERPCALAMQWTVNRANLR